VIAYFPFSDFLLVMSQGAPEFGHCYLNRLLKEVGNEKQELSNSMNAPTFMAPQSCVIV
jgi:hypothetical protein